MANEKNTNKKSTKIFGDMPHSLEAEQALLGCLIIDSKVQVEVASTLKEDDFYAEAHKYIFTAMDELIKKNQPVDMVTLTDMLEKQGTLDNVGGISYITELTNVMPSSASYKKYLNMVVRDSMLRKLIRGSASIIEDCQKSTDEIGSLAFAEKTIYEVSGEADTSEMKKIDTIIPDVMAKLDELSKDKSALRGIKTGFNGLDRLTDGLHKGSLVILAARPSVGKTSLAMNIVENVALNGYSCAVFSLEMSKEDLVQRMFCSVAEVDMGHASKGAMTKAEWLKIAKAREMLSNANIYIDDSSIIKPQELISKCRRLKRKYGLDLIMIDYIQLMTPDRSKDSSNRQNEISEISRNLKILAKEINVPVIALSQLSRDVEKRKGRPQLSDLRESGAIEQDADVVMFIHRPDKSATEKEISEGKIQRNVAELLIEKNRNGPTGLDKLFFKEECTKFLNLSEDQTPNGAVNETPYVDTEEPKKAEILPEEEIYS